MAAGDVNSRYIGRAGNAVTVSGTCEAAGGTAIYISGSASRTGNHIIQCLVNNRDTAAEGEQVVINSNNGTDDSHAGAIYLSGEAADVDTYNYYCLMTM
tara:strand:+ start:91 stop:387 length:297 start_codon:yes stop_codon:yes gene_type:complete